MPWKETSAATARRAASSNPGECPNCRLPALPGHITRRAFRARCAARSTGLRDAAHTGPKHGIAPCSDSRSLEAARGLLLAPLMRISTIARIASLVALAHSCTGCTLIGAGVGSGIDRWSNVPPRELPALKRGQRVSVDATRVEGVPVREPWARAARPAPEHPRVVDGEYLAVTRGTMVVQSEGGTNVVPLESTRRVRRRAGSRVLEGAAVGLLIDLLTVAAIASSASDIGRVQTIDDGQRR